VERNEYLQLADWRRRTAAMYARWREEARRDPEAATMRLRQARGDLFHDHPQSPLPASGRSRFTGLSYYGYDPAYRMRALLEAAPDDQLAAPDDQLAAPEPAPAQAPEQPADTVASDPGPFRLSTAYRSAAAGGGLHWPISLATDVEPDPPPIELPASGDEPFAFKRIGIVRLSGPLAGESLAVFWIEGYTGGLFLPFRDATTGSETYGAGRYLLDTAKGADLGGDPASGEIWLDFNLAYHPSCAYDARWNCPLAPPENTLRAAVRVGERLG
jgi:uncharacterized protein